MSGQGEEERGRRRSLEEEKYGKGPRPQPGLKHEENILHHPK